MKQNLKISILFTIVTTVLLGIVYPLVVTGLSQLIFRDKANGQLVSRNGEVIGSRIIGQTFAGPGYLHSRPSAAGNGYDAANSGRHKFRTHQPETHRSREGRHRASADGKSRRTHSGRVWSRHPLQDSILTSRPQVRSFRCRVSLMSVASPRSRCARLSPSIPVRGNWVIWAKRE